jgi:hypothetical protein
MTTTTETTTEHPLRTAVNAAQAAQAQAQRLFDDAEERYESEDEMSPAGRDAALALLDIANDTLTAARAALRGSDCPREWALVEEGQQYDTTTASSAEDALEEARDNVDRDNYSAPDRTLYIVVRAHCAETDEDEIDVVVLQPEAPSCESDTHQWWDAGEVFGGESTHGHGAGVICHEVCLQCGVARITDTWATRPDTGEQGCREVRYDADLYADEIATLQAKARRRGIYDGVGDVECVLSEQGAEAVMATLESGHVSWDEGAINAGAFELTKLPAFVRDAYYEAYRDAARDRAKQVTAEHDGEIKAYKLGVGCALTAIAANGAASLLQLPSSPQDEDWAAFREAGLQPEHHKAFQEHYWATIVQRVQIVYTQLSYVLDAVDVTFDGVDGVDVAHRLLAVSQTLDGTIDPSVQCEIQWRHVSRAHAARIWRDNAATIADLYEMATRGQDLPI